MPSANGFGQVLLHKVWLEEFVLTFSVAAKQPYGHVVNMTFEIMKRILNENLEDVVQQDSFSNMIGCFSELAKNQQFQSRVFTPLSYSKLLSVRSAKCSMQMEMTLAILQQVLVSHSFLSSRYYYEWKIWKSDLEH